MDPLLKTSAELLKVAGHKDPETPIRTEDHKQQGGRRKIIGIPVYRKTHEYKGKRYDKA